MKEIQLKNEELTSRREFFKKAAKKALPIIAGVAFMHTPTISNAVETKTTSCPYSCSNSCSGSCGGACSISCQNTCKGYCDGGCKGGCGGACSYSCQNTCKGYCSGRNSW